MSTCYSVLTNTTDVSVTPPWYSDTMNEYTELDALIDDGIAAEWQEAEDAEAGSPFWLRVRERQAAVTKVTL